MPTPIDRAVQSRSLFFGFTAIVTAVAAWGIWGQDLFPAQPDPTGKPEDWTEDQLRSWLHKRGLVPSGSASKEDLLERVKANLRPGRAQE